MALTAVRSTVDAVMLTGATSKTESRDIFARLTASTRNGASSSSEIKLVYVTPEKIAKSKQFMGLLEKLVTAGKLGMVSAIFHMQLTD